jgi:CspA family cold shock protein
VIKSYDPGTRDGIVVRDTDLGEYDLAPDALVGSVFRLLRQGQRVIFDLDGEGRATRLRLGSEVDMGTPGFDPELSQADNGTPPGSATPTSRVGEADAAQGGRVGSGGGLSPRTDQ